MNIKRAFLAAAAAIMVPGLAMAQITATFPTSIDFVNGDTGSVTATLTCNNGNPLVQSFDLSEAAPVAPVVQEIDPAIATCSVTIDGLADGYTAAGCEFGPDEGQTAVAESNPCVITATPDLSSLTVNRVWVNDNPDISENARAGLNCTNASATAAGPYGAYFQNLGNPAGDREQVAEFYVDPNAADGASCSVTVRSNSLDSAVEVDNGCEGPIAVAFASDEECTITFSVFYEGIPTLSQYGMAIMALLMLGVGFVGFRRFV